MARFSWIINIINLMYAQQLKKCVGALLQSIFRLFGAKKIGQIAKKSCTLPIVSGGKADIKSCSTAQIFDLCS